MIYEVVTAILTGAATITAKHISKQVRLAWPDVEELNKLTSAYESIQAVLADADKRQLSEEWVRVWIEKVEDVSYEAEDALSEWISATERANNNNMRKVCINIPCFGFKYINRFVYIPPELAIKIKKINVRLFDIAVEKDRYRFNSVSVSGHDDDRCFDHRPKTASFIKYVQGRGVDKQNLIDRLLCDRNQRRQLTVVSLVAWVGIGKTVLAQYAFNCDKVVKHFDTRIWVCATPPVDEVRIAKAILENFEHNACNLRELEPVLARIRIHIEGKKLLLVLDDAYEEDFGRWEQLFKSLETGKAGSTILVTTRKESVARAMGSTYQLGLGCLSEFDSWTMFEKIAFVDRKGDDRERLDSVGRKIAEKCKGSPLAIKVIGNEMRYKKSLSDWEHVSKSEVWELRAAEKIFRSFKSSYYDLPPTVKRCFLLCAIFPRDHVIEAKHLVQLWMAHGYLTSTDHGVEMEVVGQDYLQSLAMMSFFGDVVRDEEEYGGRIVSVKMHDLVRDFAQFLTRNVCSVIDFSSKIDFQGKMESSHKRARHLTLTVVHNHNHNHAEEDAQLPSFHNVEKLFTFWVRPFYDSPSPVITQPDRFDPDLIRRLSCARALDLSRNRIGELPTEMGLGFLTKLKFLNLSHNPFWELPETLCDMHNLQTLKLSACARLRRFPPRICKLVNLRHLEIDGTDNLKMLPKGISELTSLQTLTKFIVFPGNNDHACGLGELKNLNKLRGCLKIEGLGYALDAAEAKKAELRKKIHLSHLEMDFSPSIHNHTSQAQDAVIEALEPPENLESLQITSYRGTQLPKWMMKLTKLQHLSLHDCHNCTILPPLGTILPFLTTLHLEGMNTLKCLGLGGSAFPNLKKLKISKMESWEEWNIQTSVNNMPRLRCLKISHCTNLRELPRHLLCTSPLRKLRINNCLLLHQLYNEETGELKSEIAHIPKITVS